MKIGKNALANLTFANTCQIDLGDEITSIDSSNYSNNIVWGVEHTNRLLENADFVKQKYNITDANLELRDSTSKANEYKMIVMDNTWTYEKDTLIIPSMIDGIIIESLTHNSIENISNNLNVITDVILPKTIKKITGEFHFEKYTKLKNIDLGGLEAVGSSMFMYCPALERIVIPSTVTEILHNAFNGCSSLSDVNMTDSILTIGISSFYSCKALKTIKLHNNLTTINRNAFAYCTSLQSIIIPETVTTIGSNTFAGCTNLATITINNSEGAIEGDNTAWGCPNVNLQIIYTK